MKHIILSSELTKTMGLYVCGKSAFTSEEELVKIDFCPKLVHARFVANEKIEEEPSLSILQGRYFKTRCLGLDHIDGEPVTDLPRQSNNKKKISHVRIDERVTDFKKLSAERGLQVIEGWNTRMPLAAKYADMTYAGEHYRVWMKDEADVFPTIIDYSTFGIINLKLSKDVGNEYFDVRNPHYTSAACWGTPWNISKNEALFQHFIARNMDVKTILDFHANDLKNNPEMEDQSERIKTVLTDQVIRLSENTTLFYIIFGHDPSTPQRPQQKVIEYKWNSGRDAVLRELVVEAVNRWVTAEAEGWKAEPIPHACKSCPIKCEFKTKDIQV
ncbi:MAG: hypothetical protein ACEPOW_13965 [Bacteroidales bacterium]